MMRRLPGVQRHARWRMYCACWLPTYVVIYVLAHFSRNNEPSRQAGTWNNAHASPARCRRGPEETPEHGSMDSSDDMAWHRKSTTGPGLPELQVCKPAGIWS